MLERFVHEPLPYIVGITAVLVLLGIILRISISIARFAHRVLDMLEFIENEMKVDSGKSLKDHIVRNDRNVKQIRRSVARLEIRTRAIERRLPTDEGVGKDSR